MPTDAQLEITDLVCRFIAESDLERELAAHADLPQRASVGRATHAAAGRPPMRARIDATCSPHTPLRVTGAASPLAGA
jgi:hypothetical protein